MNYTTMKEVTKDEFYGIINEGKLDVLVCPETKEPGHWYLHTTSTRIDSHEIIRRKTNIRCGIRDGFAER